MDSKGTESGRSRSKALNFAALRAVVAVYLIYLGVTLILDMMKGESALSPIAAWALGLLFVLAGAGFGLYTWRRWKREAASARDASEEKPPEEP